jgi:hypothetical protein
LFANLGDHTPDDQDTEISDAKRGISVARFAFRRWV